MTELWLVMGVIGVMGIVVSVSVLDRIAKLGSRMGTTEKDMAYFDKYRNKANGRVHDLEVKAHEHETPAIETVAKALGGLSILACVDCGSMYQYDSGVGRVMRSLGFDTNAATIKHCSRCAPKQQEADKRAAWAKNHGGQIDNLMAKEAAKQAEQKGKK